MGGHVMRVPISGGVPQPVMETKGLWNVSCARFPSTACMIAEPSDDLKEESLTAFDPVRGRGRELFRLPLDPGMIYHAQFSPDGSHIALLKENDNRVQLVSPTGRHERDINVSGWSRLNSLDWDWDGRAVLISSSSLVGATLLRVDLVGHVQVLWTQQGASELSAIPSPDGRYLVMLGPAADRNVWMLENF
jgi:hypothetical protein